MKIEIEINCYVGVCAPDEVSARVFAEEQTHEENLILVHIEGDGDDEECCTYIYGLLADVVPELDDDIDMLSSHYQITQGIGVCNMLRVALPNAPYEILDV